MLSDYTLLLSEVSSPATRVMPDRLWVLVPRDVPLPIFRLTPTAFPPKHFLYCPEPFVAILPLL